MKSSLNRPLNPLIRLCSSLLSSDAIDVAVCSKYCLEAICSTLLLFSAVRVQLQCRYRPCWCVAFARNVGEWFVGKERVLWVEFYFCYFVGSLITLVYED